MLNTILPISRYQTPFNIDVTIFCVDSELNIINNRAVRYLEIHPVSVHALSVCARHVTPVQHAPVTHRYDRPVCVVPVLARQYGNILIDQPAAHRAASRREPAVHLNPVFQRESIVRLVIGPVYPFRDIDSVRRRRAARVGDTLERALKGRYKRPSTTCRCYFPRPADRHR